MVSKYNADLSVFAGQHILINTKNKVQLRLVGMSGGMLPLWLKLKDKFRILQPRPYFPHVPKSKRQLEAKRFEICPGFTAGDRRSSLAPFSLNRALRYVNVRPLKQLFLSPAVNTGLISNLSVSSCLFDIGMWEIGSRM